jgi:hypothetical protein
MRKDRMTVYVTWLGDSNWVEWFVVHERADGGSDLLSEGLSRWWRFPSALLAALWEWRSETMTGS